MYPLVKYVSGNVLVSPAEPKPFHALGDLSIKTEQYGADFLIASPLGMVGVQRKEYNDLLASVTGDRVYREMILMKRLDIGIWLIEGRPQWTQDGDLISRRQWSVTQHLGLLCSIQLAGFWTLYTSTIQESMQLLSALPKWLNKAGHSSLATRPKPKSSWGFRTDRDWGIHFWQTFDNIGPKVAGNLYDALGVPLKWECTRKELESVAGVGKVRAAKLWKALGGEDG